MKTDQFHQASTSWRTMLDAVTDNAARLAIFSDAAIELAGVAGKDGRAIAADELFAMATAYLAEFDPDQIQAMIADAFAKADEAPAKRKGNGKDRINGLSMREFIKMFKPPDFLIEGMLQRRFVYSLTGQTGHAKSAVALYLAELVAAPDRNLMFGKKRVAKGRVLYLVGENPDDICMRVIGAISKREPAPDPLDDQIFFVPGVFNLEVSFAALMEYSRSIGGVDLVMVDTSAAYFLGADEISNVQMGTHARLLRRLTTLPGSPCVLVLCHPIKHAIEPAQLLPRGGGAFLAEMDGNLTLWKHDDVLVDLHYTKMRGPGFEPLTFKLETIWPPTLVDAQGRGLPTVRAILIAGLDEQQQKTKLKEDEDRVLIALMFKPFASYAVIADHLQWHNEKGEPLTGRIQRALKRIEGFKPTLVKKSREGPELTDEGKKVATKAHVAIQHSADAANQADLRF